MKHSDLLGFSDVLVLAFVSNISEFLFTAVGVRQQKKPGETEIHLKGGGLLGADIPNAHVHES